jgi:phosphoglycerate dehydrogenase-like enzyme
VYGPDQVAEIQQYTHPVSSPLSAEQVLEDPTILNEVEIIFGSWGMPVLDTELLSHAQNLNAIFYGAGTIRSFKTDAAWERGIRFTNAQEANAVPVAEYCVFTIFFSLKLGFRHVRTMHREKRWHRETDQIEGCYEAKVGVISLWFSGKSE